MDLGNLFFTLGISTKDFDKKMEAEIEKAKLLKTELQNILKGTKLGVTKENAEAAKLMAEANRENAAAAKLAAQAEREKVKVALEALKLKQKEEELQNGVTAAVQRTKEAQAQNARLILSSNGHLSITKRLLGEMGTAASMYFSIFTAQHLLESLIRIRGEFDMQYISLKAILQSGEQATKLFEQIKGLAVVSPFKFMDLTTYAKQLSAYQIPTNELFNTTKRLADLSSGLGVGMDRIILAYGQVRSAAFLRGQELRQFTEAGIPMVDELASKFTKLTGTVTSAGDVFKKISDRQVPFQMVKDVIDNLTSEGGKFYNMQEKQAESLKGKVSNLADQYDIMMNRIGESNDKTLKGGVDAITAVMQNSEKLLAVIKYLIAAYGVYKVYTMMQTAAMGKNLSAMTAEEAKFRVKRANMLEEARLYRTLTLEEEAYMRHGVLGNASNNFRHGIFNRGYSRLNQADYVDLASNDRISKNEILRLGYLGKINQQSMMELATQGKITAEEMKQVMTAREQIAQSKIANVLSSFRVGQEKAVNGVIMTRLALMKLGQGLMSVFSAIVNPVTIAFGAISAIYSVVQEYSDGIKKLKDDAIKLSSDMKEEWNDIQKFISDHPIEIAIKGGQGAMTEYVKQYSEELRKILPEDLANSQIAQNGYDSNGNQRSLEEQVRGMKDLVLQAQQAKSIVEDNASALSDAANAQGGHFYSIFDGIITNFQQFSEQFETYKKNLNGISSEDLLSKLNNPNDGLSAWMRNNTDDAKKLKDAISNANVPMQKIIDMAKSMQAKSGFSLIEYLGLGGANGEYNDLTSSSSDFKIFTDQMDGMIEDFKKNLADKNIDWASKQGHDIAETFKQKLMEQNNITEESQQTMFSFAFDEKMYGQTDAAFTLLVERMKSSADQKIREAASKFEQDSVFTTAFINGLEKTKDDCIARFPMYKSELEKSWNISEPIFRAKIITSFNAQQLQEWQKELLKFTNGRYEIEIKTATNVDEALKTIEERYKEAKQFIENKKPLMLRIGYTFGNGKAWVDKNNKNKPPFAWGSGTAEGVLAGEYDQSEQLVNGAQELIKRKLLNGDTGTGGKKGRTGTGGTKKDVFTENLRKQYEQLKKAIQSYNDLIKSMGSDKAMETVKRNFGLAIDAKYLTTYGMVTLANDYMAKNIKNTDTAKGFKDTLIEDRRTARNNRDKSVYDAEGKSIIDSIQISKDQYKVYDDMFAKLGDARTAAMIAFGSDTKPYNTLVDMLKARFSEMGEKLKMNKGFSFEKMLGMSAEERAKLPDDIQKLYKDIEDANTNNLSQLRSQFVNAISNTDDEDIKIAINENLRKSILGGLNDLMKGASADDIKKAADAINKTYDERIGELKLDKIKKRLNYEDLFGDLGTLSFTQLDMLEKQLEKIVETTKDLSDPKIMKEWVSKLNSVKDAMARLEPYRNIFEAFSSVRSAREERNNIASQISSMPITEQYRESVIGGNEKVADELGKTMVTLNGHSMTYKEALDKLTKSTEKYREAQKKSQATNAEDWIISLFSKKGKEEDSKNDLTGVGNKVDVIDNNAQSMDKFRKDLGIGDDTVAGKATRSFASLSGGASGAIKSLLHGDLFGSLDSLYNGITGVFDVFSSSNQKEYERDVNNQEKLASVWNDLIDLKKEYLKTGYTEDIKQTESEIKRLYSLEEESARTLGKEYLNAAASWKSHSNGINQRDNISNEGWKQLSQWRNMENISNSIYNGVKDGRMRGLFDLSVEQIKTLKEDAPTFFAQLDDDTQKYLNQIISGSKSMSDALDEVKQKWTSTTVDEMSSGYASMLESMDDMTQNFGNSITKTLRTAVINAFMQSSSMKPYIKGWYDKLDEYMENDGKLDNNEIQSLKNGSWTYYDTDSGKTITINGAKGLLDKEKTEQQVLKDLGLYSDQSASSLSGGIKNITEETADLLASYVNAIRADVSIIRSLKEISMKDDGRENNDVISEISVSVAKIENNTKRSAENTDWIKDWMKSVTMITSNGRTVRT